MRLLLTKHWVGGPDSLLKRRNEIALLDREDLWKAQLSDDPHERRIRQGYLLWEGSYQRVHFDAHGGNVISSSLHVKYSVK